MSPEANLAMMKAAELAAKGEAGARGAVDVVRSNTELMTILTSQTAPHTDQRVVNALWQDIHKLAYPKE